MWDFILLTIVLIILLCMVVYYFIFTNDVNKSIKRVNNYNKRVNMFDLNTNSLIVNGECTIYQFVNFCEENKLYYPICSYKGLLVDEISKGSIGVLNRPFGNVTEYVSAMTIKTPKGIYSCSKDVNSNLYWAIRGSGYENFGKILEIEFIIARVPKSIQVFTLMAPLNYFKFFSHWILTLDEKKVTRKFSACVNFNKDRIIVKGIYIGVRKNLLKILRSIPLEYRLEIYQKVPPFLFFDMDEISIFDNKYTKCYYLREKLNQKELSYLRQALKNIKGCFSFQLYSLYNGKFTLNSFNHGMAALLINYEWTNEEYIEGKIDQIVALSQRVIRHNINRGCIGYFDDMLDSCHRSYYGKNIDRLIDIKNYIDPNNECQSTFDELNLIYND